MPPLATVFIIFAACSKRCTSWFTSVTVTVGQEVTAGTVIGLTGDTGNATVEHCHFELFFADGVRFDPIPYLEANASY